MIVKAYWPNCNNSDFESKPQTAYWLGCTIGEAYKNVYPRLSENVKHRSIQLYDDKPSTEISQKMGSEFIWFLISRDL